VTDCRRWPVTSSYTGDAARRPTRNRLSGDVHCIVGRRPTGRRNQHGGSRVTDASATRQIVGRTSSEREVCGYGRLRSAVHLPASYSSRNRSAFDRAKSQTTEEFLFWSTTQLPCNYSVHNKHSMNQRRCCYTVISKWSLSFAIAREQIARRTKKFFFTKIQLTGLADCVNLLSDYVLLLDNILIATVCLMPRTALGIIVSLAMCYLHLFSCTALLLLDLIYFCIYVCQYGECRLSKAVCDK